MRMFFNPFPQFTNQLQTSVPHSNVNSWWQTKYSVNYLRYNVFFIPILAYQACTQNAVHKNG